MPFLKVASADNNNLPFLEQIARKGRPLVISSGFINHIIVIMQCVVTESSWPSRYAVNGHDQECLFNCQGSESHFCIATVHKYISN